MPGTAAALRADEANARYFAGKLADLCWRLLRALNPWVTFRGETQWWDRILRLPVMPPHYEEDMRYCLGLVEEDHWQRSWGEPCAFLLKA